MNYNGTTNYPYDGPTTKEKLTRSSMSGVSMGGVSMGGQNARISEYSGARGLGGFFQMKTYEGVGWVQYG